MWGRAGMEIRKIRKKEMPQALNLFFGVAGTARYPSFPAVVPEWVEQDLHLHFVAVEGKRLLGVCFCVRLHGNVVAALPPRLMAGERGSLAADLLAAAAEHIRSRHPRTLIQTLLPVKAPESEKQALLDAGMRHLATLVYLERQSKPADARIELVSRLTWLPFERKTRNQFMEVIAATYVDSLDCPGLDGVRRMDDVLETHKHTGRFTPKCWHLAIFEGQPLGCVLTNPRRRQNVAELVYMGLVPAERRKGFGRQLALRAICDTSLLGLGALALAVDAANQPAVRLYDSLGFVEVSR
ncbi:MAG: GNAT family N-acetyltransferase, partial [Phycisphaerae bacterium]|nr:GNAT family N-acetyltransferase [Phycisphaerae bacterium]